MDKILLVSLRFKPAFVSLMLGFAKAFQELGFEIEFLVDDKYTRFSELARGGTLTTYRPKRNGDCRYYRHALFMNVSVHNSKLAQRLKKRGVKIAYLYHEPLIASVEYFKTEGIVGAVKGVLARQLSKTILRVADNVILPSTYAVEVYRKGDIQLNQNAFHLPLLFDDEAAIHAVTSNAERLYFSYVGGICRAHGFDQYVAFMRRCFLRKSNLRFLIASASPLPRYVSNDPVIRRNSDRLSIYCGRPLQNSEINKCYAESFCIWNLYRRSTQSGVLPKSFMFSTPVVASRIGAFSELVQDGYNGKFASAENMESIDAALEDIRAGFNNYQANCRNTFLTTFYYRANVAVLDRMLGTVNSNLAAAHNEKQS